MSGETIERRVWKTTSVQWHLNQGTEVELVRNTLSIRPEIEKDYAQWIKLIFDDIPETGDIKELRLIFETRPELSQVQYCQQFQQFSFRSKRTIYHPNYQLNSSFEAQTNCSI